MFSYENRQGVVIAPRIKGFLYLTVLKNCVLTIRLFCRVEEEHPEILVEMAPRDPR